MGKKKFGFSFSAKRALGISSAKSKISKKIGIPLTKSGRQKKVGRALGCCVLLFTFISMFLVLAFSTTFIACGPNGDPDNDTVKEPAIRKPVEIETNESGCIISHNADDVITGGQNNISYKFMIWNCVEHHHSDNDTYLAYLTTTHRQGQNCFQYRYSSPGWNPPKGICETAYKTPDNPTFTASIDNFTVVQGVDNMTFTATFSNTGNVPIIIGFDLIDDMYQLFGDSFDKNEFGVPTIGYSRVYCFIAENGSCIKELVFNFEDIGVYTGTHNVTLKLYFVGDDSILATKTESFTIPIDNETE